MLYESNQTRANVNLFEYIRDVMLPVKVIQHDVLAPRPIARESTKNIIAGHFVQTLERECQELTVTFTSH